MSLPAIKDHLINAVLAAAVVGGGAAVVDTKVDVARHDERITRIEELDKSMDALRDELKVTRESLVRIEERQQQEK